MKKTKHQKTTLRLEREIVRVLQSHEFGNVEGGVTRLPPEQTGDSVKVCCA
jgi:hypothetical protein